MNDTYQHTQMALISLKLYSRVTWGLVRTQRHNSYLPRFAHTAAARNMATKASPPQGDIVQEKVELHVHLDGSMRLGTIIELARKRGVDLPTFDENKLKKHIHVGESCSTLKEFLNVFRIFMPAIAGDEEAIRRIVSDFCEDSARQGIIYSEVRYCPHLLANNLGEKEKPLFGSVGTLTPDKVVKIVCDGIDEGQEKFGIKVRSILCCIRQKQEWSKEILDLCVKFKDRGVVAIDIAGNENTADDEPTHAEDIAVFQKAKELGIHRTVHAGENGNASNVREAMDDMYAERIGHGYRSVWDESVYQQVLRDKIHLECCPWSSYCTGAVEKEPKTSHPIVRFAKDGANFSISTDDPGVIGKTLNDDYELMVNQMGLTRKDVIQANLNAARSCFLPKAEKEELVERLQKCYKRYTD